MSALITHMEQQILSEALEGVSYRRGLPGGWEAVIGKDTDRGLGRVWYFHRNDDVRHSDTLFRAARAYLGIQVAA